MFRPLDKNVLLTKVEETQIKGNLYIPSKDIALYEVVNVGKEVVEIKIGDQVYLNENKIVNININNQDYYVIEERDIYLVVEE